MEDHHDPWLDRVRPPLGHGTGSYALGDARDLGASDGAPSAALPALRDGGVPFCARLRALGEQAALDPIAQAGGGWLEVRPDPYR